MQFYVKFTIYYGTLKLDEIQTKLTAYDAIDFSISFFETYVKQTLIKLNYYFHAILFKT